MHPPDESLPGASDFEDLVARALELHDDGGATAVEALLRDHPEHADQVRAAVQRLAGSGLLTPSAASAERFPERLDGFRLLRRIGGGGMGVVFLALQEDLDRQVAIKLVRPDYVYFANAKERFRREVLAVSRLQHPGIVPIWHVGETGGLPYFAMEYVPGCSLAELLEVVRRDGGAGRTGRTMQEAARRAGLGGEPGSGSSASRASQQLFAGSWEQACLRVALHVAEAMCHAHDRQIVHRDLKPSNVMITADGQVRLVDFGLAWLESEDQLTRSNAMLGSLSYMSPEQLRGAGVDRRTDVYSLGATLYELLTLQVPFDQQDPAAIRESILRGDWTPLRRLDPRISRDTETICAKAMATRCEHRYPTMQDLAADLRNLLDRRPITARPPSPWLRSTRWVQRNTVASLTLVILVLLVLSLTALSWQQWSANARLAHANRQLEAANRRSAEHLQLARTNLDFAKQAIDRMLTRVAARALQHVPLLTPIRERLLGDALRLYTDLAAGQDDPGVRHELATMELRIGNLNLSMGAADAAEQRIRSAIERLTALDAIGATRPYELAMARVHLGQVCLLRNRPQDALELYQRAMDRLEFLHDTLADDPAYLTELASLYRSVATLFDQHPELRGNDARARRDYDAMTLELSEAVARHRPDDLQSQDSLAREYRRHGLRLIRHREYDAALRRLRESLALYEHLHGKHPPSAAMLNSIAMAHAGIADVHRLRRDYPESLAALQAELAVRRQQTTRFPAYIEYLGNMGATLHNIAAMHIAMGDAAAAEPVIREALARQPDVDAVLPDHPVFRDHYFLQTVTLCRALSHQGHYRALAETAPKLAERSRDRTRGLVATAEWRCIAITTCRHQESPLTPELRRWITDQQDLALADLQRAAETGQLRRRDLARGTFGPVATDPRFAAVRAKAIE